MRRSALRVSSLSRLVLALVLACGLVTAAGPARAASLRVQGFSQATNDPNVQDLVDETGGVGPISGGASSAGLATVGSGAASGDVTATAEYGVLRARATGSASGPFGDIGGAVAGGSIEASWSDRFTIVPSDPSLQFQPGTFVFRLLLGGTLTANAGGATESNTRAQFGLNVDAGTCSVGCDFRLFGELGDFGSQSGGVIYTGDPIADFTSTPVPFAFGIPIDLSVALQAFAQAVAGVPPVLSTADADIGGTLAWGGLLQVSDSNGDPVTAYGVTSESSVDWSQPVPEPASGTCVALGVVLLAAATRRSGRAGLTERGARPPAPTPERPRAATPPPRPAT